MAWRVVCDHVGRQESCKEDHASSVLSAPQSVHIELTPSYSIQSPKHSGRFSCEHRLM